MSAWESTRTPSLRKSASCSIIALRNNSESPILSSSATVHSPSVDWSLLKEPHGGRLRQRPLPFTHSRGHYPEPLPGPPLCALLRTSRSGVGLLGAPASILLLLATLVSPHRSWHDQVDVVSCAAKFMGLSETGGRGGVGAI